MKMVTLSGLLAAAVTAGGALADPISCTHGDLTRTIEVVYSEPGQPVPCEVIYDKSAEGSIETLWRASSEAGYCEEKAAALAEKLGRAGWQCAVGAAEKDAPEA